MKPQTLCAVALAVCTAFCVPAVAKPQVEVSEATMRMPRAGFSSTAVFVSLRAEHEARIVGASSTVARSVELRTMRRGGIDVTMDRADAIVLPAGKDVRLRTGVGEHFLLASGLRRPLHPGEQVPITLKLQDARGGVSTLRVKARVIAPASYSPVEDDHAH